MLLDSDLSSSVTSNSDTEPASVAGVKIAYDKGVEAKNRADEIIASFVGSVAYFATDTAPNGWLKANGAAVSRTTYAELFAKIGTTFGAGNGYSTFNLPDLRGEFLRGLDDGRNVDAGRRLGSTQGDAIRNITGEVWAGIEETQGNGVGAFRIKNFGRRGGSGSHWDDGFTFDASRVVPTADENRPRNVALLACIKY
ncbi:phage tail protein [Mannheimia sp. ZY171111]|nr:phage tail protein [Mannheimia sp. ZY171111]